MKKFPFLLTIFLLMSSSLLQAMEYEERELEKQYVEALAYLYRQKNEEIPKQNEEENSARKARLKERADHWLLGQNLRPWTKNKKPLRTCDEIEKKYADLKGKTKNNEQGKMLEDVMAYLKILEEDYLVTPNNAGFLEILGIQEFLGNLSEDSESIIDKKLNRQKSARELITLARAGSEEGKDVPKKTTSLPRIDPNNTVSTLRQSVKNSILDLFPQPDEEQIKNNGLEFKQLEKYHSVIDEQSIEETERQNQKAIKELEIAERREALNAKRKTLTETIALKKNQEEQENLEKQRQLNELKERKQEIESRKKELQEKLKALKEKEQRKTNS